MLKKIYQRFIKPVFCSSMRGVETKKGLKMKNDEEQIKSTHLSSKAFPKMLIDSELIPLFKQAEQGQIDAIIDLAYSFYKGKGAKIDDGLAIKYFEMLFEALPEHQYLARYHAQFNIANIEARRGNYDELILRFYNMTKLMYKDFPFEEWRFDDFAWMKEIALSKPPENG